MTRLQAYAAVSDFPLDFGTRHESRNAVYDDGVDSVGAHEHVADFKRLLSCIGLGDKDFVYIDPETGCIGGVERMFCIDEGDDASERLGLGENLKGKRGFAA